MSTTKVFKKGEFIFREGEKVTGLYIIQSGGASLCLARPKKNIELFQVGANQVLGDQCLSNGGSHYYSAVATTDTKIVEVPVDVIRQMTEQTAMIKMFLKSLSDRLKIAISDVKSSRLERDSSPCPEDQVAKIFGAIFHTANHKGTVNDEKHPENVSIDWQMMKQYAQRVFAESPKRLEQALCVLVKMQIAKFEMGKAPDDPEGPDQIMKVHFMDLPAVEAFFEFYQYYYFKGGKTDLLKSDSLCTSLLGEFVALGESVEPDRFGAVSIDYQKTIERFKADLNINLNPDHFSRLEQKGIFCKRQSRADGQVILQFDLKEFKTTQKIWKLLYEIEKWNEKGFVDMNEEDPKKKKKDEGPSCSQCGSALQPAAKFCSECGFKLAA